jgi:hypothetical protein
MDAMQKRRMWKVAAIHFCLSLGVYFLLAYAIVNSMQPHSSNSDALADKQKVELLSNVGIFIQALAYISSVKALHFLAPSGSALLVLCPLWSVFIGWLVSKAIARFSYHSSQVTHHS